MKEAWQKIWGWWRPRHLRVMEKRKKDQVNSSKFTKYILQYRAQSRHGKKQSTSSEYTVVTGCGNCFVLICVNV